MSEKPILFSTAMVQAILDGRKMMTRRIIKKQPDRFLACDHSSGFFDTGGNDWACRECGWGIGTDGHSLYHAPYQPGDTLWVRETWKCIQYDNFNGDFPYGVEFKVDGKKVYTEFHDNERYEQFGKFALKNGWQSPYFMPREAVRLFLRVKDVRVERVQDITENDVRREGFRDSFNPLTDTFYPCGYHFVETWNNLNAKRGFGWGVNPWVWVIEFEVIPHETL